jgi:hypothetical protein
VLVLATDSSGGVVVLVTDSPRGGVAICASSEGEMGPSSAALGMWHPASAAIRRIRISVFRVMEPP